MPIRRILAQSRPSATAAESLFEQNYDDPVEMGTLHVVNTSGASCNVSVFHDQDGTTFDQSTALIYEYPLPAKEWLDIDEIIGEWSELGNIGIQVSVANACTFTLYGTSGTEKLSTLQINEGV